MVLLRGALPLALLLPDALLHGSEDLRHVIGEEHEIPFPRLAPSARLERERSLEQQHQNRQFTPQPVCLFLNRITLFQGVFFHFVAS